MKEPNDLTTIEGCLEEIDQLRHDNGEHQYVRAYFIVAMNDLLNRPKGVVPESAQLFYDNRNGVFK